jgi:acyl-CoA synthetase (AMP-forming)/AMP-acid ligase II
LIDYLDRGAMLAPQRDCLVRHDGSVRFTYAEVADLSHRIAARLRSDGFGPGTRIGVYSPNDPTGFIVVLGVLRAGATWVAMNVKSPPGELAELLDLLDCDLLIRHHSLIEETARFRHAAASRHGRDGRPPGMDGARRHPC